MAEDTDRSARAFDILSQKYVQRADDRQKEMGLQYTEAETHDLAVCMAQFAEHEIVEHSGDLNFIRVFESWGERETGLTGVLLDLAIAATMVKLGSDGGELTVTTVDLRQIAENYDIQREESAGGWTIKLTKRA